MTLGERVAYIIKLNKLNGDEFAKVFNKSGANISSIVNNKTKPSPELAIAICERFGCTLDWFWAEKGSFNGEKFKEVVQEPIVDYELQSKYLKILEENNELHKKLNKEQTIEIEHLQLVQRG